MKKLFALALLCAATTFVGCGEPVKKVDTVKPTTDPVLKDSSTDMPSETTPPADTPKETTPPADTPAEGVPSVDTPLDTPTETKPE